MKSLKKKKVEYKREIEKVESFRDEYIVEQSNIFSVKEKLERDCKDESKVYFKDYFKIISGFLKKFEINEKDIDIIEKMNGDKNTRSFTKSD